MNGRTTIRVTLIVKGEPEVVAAEVERRLGRAVIDWFCEDGNDGASFFREGSLLWYRVENAEMIRERETAASVPQMDEAHISCSDCQDFYDRE